MANFRTEESKLYENKLKKKQLYLLFIETFL